MIGDRRIAFIGCGHITEIILHNLVDRQVARAENIVVSDPLAARLRHLEDQFGVATTHDNVAAARRGELIFINLRPEVVASVLPELEAAALRPDQVLISLAAGIPLSHYAGLGVAQPLVRGLPNPPSRIGQGVAALVFTPQVSPAQREEVRLLFASLGQVVEVDEPALDVITSLSSPVATHLFFQSLIDAGVRCGLSRAVATAVAGQTIIGSMALWQARGASPAELIAEASTPGGISVEVLFALEQHAFKAAVMDAIARGADRATALGRAGA
jgi:pyrroline-5-carboxylate reductase